MNRYRCTRNKPYSNPKCDGFSDHKARLGYFIDANSAKEAIVELIELGLTVATSQQSNQTSMTVQDSVMAEELSQTIKMLAEQINQLNDVVQDDVLQRLTLVEIDLVEKCSA